MRDHDARHLPRAERRRLTLAALTEVAAKGRVTLAPAIEALEREGLVEFSQPLRFRDRWFVSAKPEALPRLLAIPAVAALLPEFDSVREARRRSGDQTLRVAPPVPPGDSWAIEFLGLRPLWDAGIDGRGVVVGILDSGVLPNHLALYSNRRGKPDWYDPVGGTPDPIDTVPHGSLVLSCAVGRAVDGHALGAAPGASWVAALANQHNSYNNVNMSLAADWLLFEAQPDVVLGAWGHGRGSCDDEDRVMIEAFRAAGTVPVFAAGNNGPSPGSGDAPATLDGFYPDGGGPLAVAAVDRNGAVIGPSSRGPSGCGHRLFPDVAAPGWELPVPCAPNPNSLTLASGTSFAVGWVGGVVALVLQIRPDLPVSVVEDLIRHTTRDAPVAGHDDARGYGIVDPRRAVEAARDARY